MSDSAQRKQLPRATTLDEIRAMLTSAPIKVPTLEQNEQLPIRLPRAAPLIVPGSQRQV